MVGNHKSVGNWSAFKAAQGFTFRELKASHYILQAFSKILPHQRVKWFSDSQNSCTIVNVGSPTFRRLQ